MIGKAPATGSGFRGIVNYLVMGKLGQEKDRVAWSETRNLIVDEPELVPRIMRSTASRSTRCSEPVYHFAICWHKSEVPSRGIQAAIADATLEDLDLTEHQSLLIAHKDTEHHHLHIVVNRVHPETAKAWDRWKDWVRIEKSLGRQAKEHGLIYVPGRHNEPEKFREVPTKARNSEFRCAERLGTKDQLRPRWSKEQIAEKRAALVPTFEQVRNWGELERALAQQGLGLERKGQGIVIGDASGTMKLSDLKKDIRLGSLEGRFGESWHAYELRRDEPEPMPAPAQTSTDDEDAEAAKTPKPHPLTTPDFSETTPVRRIVPEDADDAGATASITAPGDGALPSTQRTDDPQQPDQQRAADAEFARRWHERVRKTEARRADDERRKADADKVAAKAALERRRQAGEEAERLALLKRKFARAPEPSPVQQPAAAKVPPPASPADPALKARQEAHVAKSKASAEVDLAFTLHQAGLVTRKQLAHSVRDREAAQDAGDKHAGIDEKLKRDLQEALRPKQPSVPKEKRHPPPKRNKPEPER